MRNASDTTSQTTTGTTRGTTTARVIRIIQVLAVLGAAVAVLTFPQTGPTPFIMSVGVVILSYACMATGWNFVGGFTGYISLGHAAFTGLGGYAVGLLILRAEVSPWLALVLAATIVAVLSIRRDRAWIRVLRSPGPGRRRLVLAACFISVNWLVYVWAIAEGRSAAAGVDAYLRGSTDLPAPIAPDTVSLTV